MRPLLHRKDSSICRDLRSLRLYHHCTGTEPARADYINKPGTDGDRPTQTDGDPQPTPARGTVTTITVSQDHHCTEFKGQRPGASSLSTVGPMPAAAVGRTVTALTDSDSSESESVTVLSDSVGLGLGLRVTSPRRRRRRRPLPHRRWP
jgi:hypothetical protein